MKNTIITAIAILLLSLNSWATDTVYVSKDKHTLIEFEGKITEVSSLNNTISFEIKDSYKIQIRANSTKFIPTELRVDTEFARYNLYLDYSYGRAGRIVKVSKQSAVYNKVQKTSRKEDLATRLLKYNKLKITDRFSKDKVTAKIARVLVSGDSLFFRLQVNNRSAINFDIDFIGFYVKDLSAAKRTVTQERQIYPIKSIGLEQGKIYPHHSNSSVFILPKFPLAKGQALYIEIYEKEGARHLYLKVSKRDIREIKSIHSIFNP